MLLNSSHSCQKELFLWGGDHLPVQPALPSRPHIRTWQVPIPWEPDPRRLLPQPHLAGMLSLLVEGNSLLWGDASSGGGCRGSRLLPSEPAAYFTRNCIFFSLALARTCLPPILHLFAEPHVLAEWWITG